MDTIQTGDFFSTPGKGFTGWLNEKGTITPAGRALPKAEWKSHQTKRFHFGVIADTVYDTDGNLVDYETRESISKGPSTLRFFERYAGQDIELYRLPGITPEEGVRLVRSISLIGDKPYGFKDFIAAGFDAFTLCLMGQFPPYTPEQFYFSRNDAYICTEIPAFGADQIGKPVEPPGHPDLWDIPVLYLQAIEEGRLIRYYKGDLKDLR